MAASAHPRGIVDTDIVVDSTRRLQTADDFLNGQLALGPLLISVVSVMELVQGCRNASELARVRRLLAGVSVVPISEAASIGAASLMDQFFLSHGLFIPDALIAATAQALGMTLYTKNLRDFRMIPGLTAVRPY